MLPSNPLYQFTKCGPFKYVPKNQRKIVDQIIDNNKISSYVETLLRNPVLRYHPSINTIMSQVKKGCVYLSEELEKAYELNIFNSLKKDLEEHNNDIQTWSKHYKIDNPKKLPTFNKIVDLMAKKFNVQVVETRLNYYPDELSWKPYHQDRHSTYDNTITENFTMGASFGAERALSFKHIETDITFDIPQKNGDIFAFDANVNKLFMHGVPKISHLSQPRFSIIAWGKK